MLLVNIGAGFLFFLEWIKKTVNIFKIEHNVCTANAITLCFNILNYFQSIASINNT